MASAGLAPAPSGDDLFELANAICACIDAPVTIEDRSSRVLAFSGRQDEGDAMRIATVLGLRVPEDHVSGPAQRAALRRIASSAKVCFFDADALGGGHVTLGRAAVAVHAGDQHLGYIWAAVREPLAPALEDVLLRAADVVALHLQRTATDTDRARRQVAEQVARAVAGGVEAGGALAELGLPAGPSVVLAMDVASRPGRDGGEDHAGLLAGTERLRAALASHLAVTNPGAVVADLHGSIVSIVPATAPDAVGAIQRTCRDFLLRADRGVQAAIGIGNPADTPADLPRAYAEAGRALRVVRADMAAHGERVACAADVEIDSMLLELGRVCEENAIHPSGAYARLREHDRRRSSRLLETVAAWLDAHGENVIAAESLHVHPNTFRYRLRRAGEVGEVDLHDPRERFALHLQLRLFGGGPRGGR